MSYSDTFTPNEGTGGAHFTFDREDLRSYLPETGPPRSRFGWNSLMSHSNMILAILDQVQDIHPFIKTPFKATLSIILCKQTNDKRIVALILEMMHMMSPLTELSVRLLRVSRKDYEGTVTATEQGVQGDFTRVLTVIKNDIEAGAKLANCFSKAPAWDRLLRGKEWSEQFQDLGKRFKKNRSDLQLALSLRTSLAVDGLQSKIDHIILLIQSSMGLCFTNEPSVVDVTTHPDGIHKSLYWTTSRELDEFRTLNNRTPEFGRGKLDMSGTPQNGASSGCKAKENHDSTNDPYAYIEHPDIRKLWREMGWRMSVKTRKFVAGLYHHYLLQSDPSSEATQWCQVRHLPRLNEVFDVDCSGFVRMQEVNAFTAGVPGGWELSQWIGYWVMALPVENWIYAVLIRGILMKLADLQLRVKQENVEAVNDYINGLPIAELHMIIKAVTASHPSTIFQDSELRCLALAHRPIREAVLKDGLERVNYHVDCDNSGTLLLNGVSRIEQNLLPLLFLLLTRHSEIMNYACHMILAPLEMDVALESIDNVFKRVWQRVGELKESFRQRGQCVNDEFNTFSDGIYSLYYCDDPRNWIGYAPPQLEIPSSCQERNSELNKDPDRQQEVTNHEQMTFSDGMYDSANTLSFLGALENPCLDIAPLNASNIACSNTCIASADYSHQHPKRPQVDVYSRVLEVGHDPTHFGPFFPDTSLYLQPVEITDETLPWYPLEGGSTASTGHALFQLAIEHVLVRVRLLSPRMTWAHLHRRRTIRMKWLEISGRADRVYLGKGNYEDRIPSNSHELECLKRQLTPADVRYFTSLADLQRRRSARHL
ncbi:hypothetical protein K439DRAFT_1611658 [Ramaria rubella]|nr:hypothetical protein K439DRAFT_1611658 [Ramaria rubella]